MLETKDCVVRLNGGSTQHMETHRGVWRPFIIQPLLRRTDNVEMGIQFNG